MIPPQVERRFSGTLRERGARYAAQRRVTLEPMQSQDLIHATVLGSERYDVVIELQAKRRWEFECSCPYAEDNYTCKHIWAVLLAADRAGLLPGGAAQVGKALPEWQRRLKAVKKAALSGLATPVVWPEHRCIVYSLDLDSLATSDVVVIEVDAPRPRTPGRRHDRFEFTLDAWLNAPDERDRQLAHLLCGARSAPVFSGHAPTHRFVIPPAMYATTLRAVCETGRLRFRTDGHVTTHAVAWDDGPLWSARFRLVEQKRTWQLAGDFVRMQEVKPFDSLLMVTAHGLIVSGDTIARFDATRGAALLPLLGDEQPLTVPESELFDFLAEVTQLPGAAVIEVPPQLGLTHSAPVPVPRLVVKAADYRLAIDLQAELSFDYDGHSVPHGKPGSAIILREERCIVHRQPAAELAAAERLLALGLHESSVWREHTNRFVLAADRLTRIVEAVCAEGWHVEADGKRYRAATRTEVSVSSGIDWFELNGAAQFDAQQAALPQLLNALRKGEKFVVLDDGTVGLLPVQWLQRFAGIAQLGQADGQETGIRFTHAQTALLDALLATLPEPQIDETFQRMRTELARFERITPADTVPTFQGTLRPYQREGLGWLNFLRRFSLGGCLADDMGLGKTVQVLALLEQCRCAQAGPALIVVPASLVFNWKEEAARFAPALRVRDYTGLQRRERALDPAGFDVLVTTYGTLRRDAPALREIEFDTIVLDEAQAIKNAKTASAKAARLLRAKHRIALSGTPIENRLEELWSLYDFLNPGMLGAPTAFAALRKNSDHNAGTNGRSVLARALRPVMLRRTKEQVAPELPPRIEQTLLVELEPAQRKLYDELREHYRNALLPRVDKVGIKRVQIEILEALLRLRQAACHTGLIDAKRKHESSAKLDVLADQLAEIVAEGHKALVFSQFTTFLDLVRTRLETDGLTCEYLDGKTRDRQARVQRFQSDPHCPLFLISLRAGGYGLNLTAADYVFVLDPWWNPAVEAQAIDRTHRIGQQKKVMALRLIARDTVEEKVLELQRHKRALADAILGADAGGLAGIGRAELELLLG